MNYRPDKVQLMSSSWLTRAYRQLCPFITPKDSLLKPHPYYYWLWKRLATSDTVHVYAVNVTPTHLLLHLLRANHSHMQTFATCFYRACVCSARYELRDSWSHASLAWVLHCDALRCRADSTRTSLRCFMNPYTSTWGIFRYSMKKCTNMGLHSLVMQLLSFNLSFTSTWACLLPRHLNSSLLYPTLHHSTLLDSAQLHGPK